MQEGKVVESFNVKTKDGKKLHKKFGFKQYGRFPKECLLRDGSYCDHTYVYKIIKKLD